MSDKRNTRETHTIIDPENITNYYRSDIELQLFLLFCVFVVNKNSNTTAEKINKMFVPDHSDRWSQAVMRKYGYNPFEFVKLNRIHPPFGFLHYLREQDEMRNFLTYWRIGQYKRIIKSIYDILDLFKYDYMSCENPPPTLNNVTVEQLEGIHGIGPKTARFFVLHSRKDQKYAVLDTHLQRWLDEVVSDGVLGFYPYCIGSKPLTGSWYRLWESIFLGEASRRNLSPADLDLQIWRSSRKEVKQLDPVTGSRKEVHLMEN